MEENDMRQEIAALKAEKADLLKKNQELEGICLQKDRFFSIIAHDLKSPFNVVLGFTQLLVDEAQDMTTERIKEFAGMIHVSASNAVGLLTNLLDWSRSKTGAMVPELNQIILWYSLNNVLENFFEAAVKRNISIKLDIPKEFLVIADKNMLASILRNLISNAMKFTNDDGYIKISAKVVDKFIEIAVKDSGIGMDAEIIKRLFLFEGQSGRKGLHGEQSTGLGLSLCREFIEKQRGKIWVESEENVGSTFFFTIPKG